MENEPRDIFFVSDKDPNFVYYWANRADRNLIQMLGDGAEIVRGAPEIPREVLDSLRSVTGQSTETPVSSEVRTRGDLILVRWPKDVYEERIAKPERLARERQRASLDTIVEQANEQTRARLAQARQSNIRARHVFSTSDDAKFEDQGVKS